MQDELGIEPTRALSELERSILQQDPALDLPAAPRPLARVRGGRRLFAAATAAALAVTAGLVAFLLWPRGDIARAVPVANNSVAVVDPRTNRVVDDIVAGDYPGPLASDGRYVWVGNIGNNTMMAVDAKTRKAGLRDRRSAAARLRRDRESPLDRKRDELRERESFRRRDDPVPRVPAGDDDDGQARAV